MVIKTLQYLCQNQTNQGYNIFIVMNFSKENRKYLNRELEHNVSNYFTFSIKELQQTATKLDKAPSQCKYCEFPKFDDHQTLCYNCNKPYEDLPEKSQQKIEEDQVQEPETIQEPQKKTILSLEEKMKQKAEQYTKNFKYTTFKQELKSPTKCVILCVDLSGSMCISYQTSYKKINEELVSKILGKNNYDQLASKLGKQKVNTNYETFQLLLNEGETPRNIIEMFKSLSNGEISNEPEMKSGEEKQKIEGYITRKQIIGVGIIKYLQSLKSRQPDTYFTIVYFNNDIEIPVHGFSNVQSISGLEGKTIEEMIQLGEQYGDLISVRKSKQIEDDIIKNYNKVNENGQTAMTPAVVFCIGLAKKLKHTLNQILVITDGYSNVGFGQTQNEMETEQTTRLYETLAIQFAKPNNCVINFMTFEDCAIGYDILDLMVGITGGTVALVTFQEEAGEKIVKNESISSMTFNIIQSFASSTRLCYDTKIMLGCSNDRIKLKLPAQITPFVHAHHGNTYLLNLGILSPKFSFKIYFELDLSKSQPQIKMEQKGVEEKEKEFKIDEFQDKNVIITVMACYGRRRKQTMVLKSSKIIVSKGNEEQASKEEAKILTKQIKFKLQIYDNEEIDLSELNDIKQKLQKNEKILKQMDPKLLEQFQVKKEEIANVTEGDKLKRDQMTMKSRTYKTYKARESDHESEDDGFS